MSLSINRHLITTSYDHSNTVKSNENGLNNTAHTTHRKSNDSLELSKEFAEYAGGMQTPLPTENYSNVYDRSQDTFTLTMDQQKTLLSDLQSYLTSSSTTSEADELTNSTKNPLASITDLLSGVDLSTATDEEVSDLFDKVAETIQNNRPAPPPEGGPFQPEADSSGLPPMMQAMGGIMPPFAWNIQETSNQEDHSTSSEQELTIDEKRSLLSDLQSILSSSAVSGSTTLENDPETDLLSALKNAMGNTDESNASDEEISALFDKIAKIFEQSVSSSS
ncbi:hypothetical protein B4V02_18150 [Paenibacillus kribbensis]|uniref:Uncharacterized protein n=1 Tax=Paenibacillus kribbensis TaxID=172713 RepID=A0A222WRW7_9BACL|nr:hypothetical protein [Paenibacillus kribbensis]ASR48481.1 hypothetical protein B4V02_18150 [Paenibacillus kribbensis]